MCDDGECLPDELVGDGDHSEFARLSVLSKPCVSFSALSIEPAGRPSGDTEKSSGVCVFVSVDVSSDVYGSFGLFVSRTDTEIPGRLLGILEVSEPAGSDNECRSERYAYSLAGCQECELPTELGFDQIREFRLKPVTPFFKELDCFIYGMGCLFVRNGQTYERTSKVRHDGNLLGELTYDGPFLSEPQDGLSLYLERRSYRS